MTGTFLSEDSYISILITFITEVFEIGDGPVFTQALENVSDFDFEGETLMLYFSQNSFLLFKRK